MNINFLRITKTSERESKYIKSTNKIYSVNVVGTEPKIVGTE
jgi:hypothetical protein